MQSKGLSRVFSNTTVQKHQFSGAQVSGSINTWQIDGETMETAIDFILGGSKITADSDCSHEVKKCLLLERKVMTNLDSIFKSRDITLPAKVHFIKAMVFPGVMYGCERWTIKKGECGSINSMGMSLIKLGELVMNREVCRTVIHGGRK